MSINKPRECDASRDPSSKFSLRIDACTHFALYLKLQVDKVLDLLEVLQRQPISRGGVGNEVRGGQVGLEIEKDPHRLAWDTQSTAVEDEDVAPRSEVVEQ